MTTRVIGLAPLHAGIPKAMRVRHDRRTTTVDLPRPHGGT
jgi:hypothetical protein